MKRLFLLIGLCFCALQAQGADVALASSDKLLESQAAQEADLDGVDASQGADCASCSLEDKQIMAQAPGIIQKLQRRKAVESQLQRVNEGFGDSLYRAFVTAAVSSLFVSSVKGFSIGCGFSDKVAEIISKGSLVVPGSLILKDVGAYAINWYIFSQLVKEYYALGEELDEINRRYTYHGEGLVDAIKLATEQAL